MTLASLGQRALGPRASRAQKPSFRSRLALQAEIVALRHQLTILQRTSKQRIRLRTSDRVLWVWLSQLWYDWHTALMIVRPETVIRWHRQGFRLYWCCKSRHAGRPNAKPEIRKLVWKMCRSNPTWGAPRIHGELLKLGIDISQATVSKYMIRRGKPPSQTWRTFLNNHTKQVASVDFFTVATLTFRVLYVFVILLHKRRRVIHYNVTDHPTAEWTSQQLVQAFPCDTAPRYLLRDRDSIYGTASRELVANMGVTEVLTAPRSSWQSPYVERLIGLIRRECLDHILVLSEESPVRTLKSYMEYYHDSRCHLGLSKDCRNKVGVCQKSLYPATRLRCKMRPQPRRRRFSRHITLLSDI
jgi:putative transposase